MTKKNLKFINALKKKKANKPSLKNRRIMEKRGMKLLSS